MKKWLNAYGYGERMPSMGHESTGGAPNGGPERGALPEMLDVQSSPSILESMSLAEIHLAFRRFVDR